MTTVQVQQNDATVTLEGALTVAQAQALRPQLQKAMTAGVSSVVFDLGGSDVVDSSGIGLLIATHNSLHAPRPPFYGGRAPGIGGVGWAPAATMNS